MTQEIDRHIREELCRSLQFLDADPNLVNRVRLAPADSLHNELNEALKRLGADRELLATVGSLHDTLDDEEILDLLQEWNEWELLHRDPRG